MNAGSDSREELWLPEGWISRDVQHESTLLYTKQRDIHDAGVVLMQMLFGLNVAERFPDPASAIRSCKLDLCERKLGDCMLIYFPAANISSALANHVLLMLEPPKKVVTSCESLLADPMLQLPASHSPSSSPVTSRAMTFGGRTLNGYGPGTGALEPKTPRHHAQMGSPDGTDYFRLGAFGVSMAQQRKQTSRWKEDWEELELLVRFLLYGSTMRLNSKLSAG